MDCITKMLTSQVYKSSAGQHFTLKISSKSHRIKSVNAERFIDHHSALHFVYNLQVPLLFWENLANSNDFFNYHNWQTANPWASIEHYIAQALVQGSVQAFSSVSPNELHETRQARSLKDSFGKKFELQAANNALLDNCAEIKPVHDKRSAEQLLQEMEITSEAAEVMTKSLNLPAQDGKSIEALTDALVNGDVVLTQLPDDIKPAGDGEFVEEVVAKAQEEAPPKAAPSESKTVEKDTTPVRDDKASAKVLEQAAEEGTPFCEECEKNDGKQAA